MKKLKKLKKKKLEKTVTIRRRLMRLWLERVRMYWGNECAICGVKSGAPLEDGKKVILDCHHIEARSNNVLRYELANGILLCKRHHKFGRESFHRSPVWSVGWLKNHHPDILHTVYIFRHLAPYDLNDRETLKHLENELKLRRTK